MSAVLEHAPLLGTLVASLSISIVALLRHLRLEFKLEVKMRIKFGRFLDKKKGSRGSTR